MARVYRDYNRTRQSYILHATAAHFGKRDDDPAPLYGKTLLDVGCGESTIGEFLALSGADITAVDPNPEVLARARVSAEHYGAPVHFLQSRVEDLINSLPRYDVILALDILEETADAPRLVWTLRQLLKPGGVIIFSAINKKPKSWFIHIFLSQYVYRRVPHGGRRYGRFQTPRQLAAMAGKVGLKLSGVQGLSFTVSEQKWHLTGKPDTRYLATATF
jgi:2-polyprenyl-6-hydroxyphenyl methylase/3-demethylubiquinone-9 3-methyltransferase